MSQPASDGATVAQLFVRELSLVEINIDTSVNGELIAHLERHWESRP